MRTAASVVCWRKVLPRKWPHWEFWRRGLHWGVRPGARDRQLLPGDRLPGGNHLRPSGGSNDTADPNQLLSSSGLSIWAKGDPVHLTPTAYGDLADVLINNVSSATSVGAPLEKRKRIESVVTKRKSISFQEAKWSIIEQFENKWKSNQSLNKQNIVVYYFSAVKIYRLLSSLIWKIEQL